MQNQNNQSEKKKKALTLKNAIILLNERQKISNAFESEILPKENKEKDLQIF